MRGNKAEKSKTPKRQSNAHVGPILKLRIKFQFANSIYAEELYEEQIRSIKKLTPKKHIFKAVREIRNSHRAHL